MNKIKRITALLLACAMGVGFSSCGENSKYIATVDGETEVPAGIYVISQMNAISEAESSEDFDSTLDDIHDNVIEDQDFDTWILNRAEEMVKEYAAVNAMFDESGMEFEDQDSVDYYVDNMWAYYESTYESYGISEDSYASYITNQYKYSDLFIARYGEGGSEEVPEEDIIEQMNKDYTVVQVLPFSLLDEDGNELSDSEQSEVYDTAEEYLQKVEDGADMADLRYEIEQENADADTEVTEDENEYKETIQDGGSTDDISSTLSTAIFESAKVGEPVILSDEDGYYVVLRYEATEIESNYDTYKDTVLMTLKEDDFDEVVDDYAATMDIEFNNAAIKTLKFSKLLS